MNLGIAQDFSVNVDLDSQLKTVPSNGLFANIGVHPSITVQNLLEFLPKVDFSFTDWDNAKSYKSFKKTLNIDNIVLHDNKIWQCILTNTNQTPAEGVYWTETNLESLRLKIFLYKVEERVYTELSLNKDLVDNQFLYENGTQPFTPPQDYCGWTIEPKGSDYVSFRINQVSIQKTGTTPVDLYVLHNNTLQETIQITPANGALNFVDTDIVLSGKGVFRLVIDSTEVLTDNGSVDPLKYHGFIVYTCNGTGDNPQGADYNFNTMGNGIGLNITAYLDAKQYIDNNMSWFGSFIRSTFEYMALQMFLHNSSNRINRTERIQLNRDSLNFELKEMRTDTVVKRFFSEKKKAIRQLEKTFDNQLKDKKGYNISVGSM